mmetsp:Transcript_5523/g.11225  ORF Transcript_5523/g.11225 Transcript_5523/m.11225 type:complete len:126 (-) Transcript_5523:17-394(-)
MSIHGLTSRLMNCRVLVFRCGHAWVLPHMGSGAPEQARKADQHQDCLAVQSQCFVCYLPLLQHHCSTNACAKAVAKKRNTQAGPWISPRIRPNASSPKPKEKSHGSSLEASASHLQGRVYYHLVM